MARTPSLKKLIADARACRRCEPCLPHGARPVFRAARSATLLIVGQAPGRRVHESGIPWDDASGEVLREWLQLERDDFYDTARIAIVPSGLCYPGTRDGADLPPRPECAALWQPRFRAALPAIGLTLLVGGYAQGYHLGARRKGTLTETVRAYAEYLPDFFPLPHPSWRNRFWRARNPWFDKEVLPALRRRLRAV